MLINFVIDFFEKGVDEFCFEFLCEELLFSSEVLKLILIVGSEVFAEKVDVVILPMVNQSLALVPDAREIRIYKSPCDWLCRTLDDSIPLKSIIMQLLFIVDRKCMAAPENN